MYLKSLIILLFCSQIAFAQNKKTQRFIEDYLQVAFWEVQGVNRPLIKWAQEKQQITYKIIGEHDYLNDKSWEEFITELGKLTGKDIIATQEADYDILIFLGDLNEYARLTGSMIPPGASIRFNNWSNRTWNTQYQLQKASYCLVPSKINTTYEGVYHLKHGFLKSLGILGEIDDQYSIFYKYPTSSSKDLSRLDKRLIKLHYHDQVVVGSDHSTIEKRLYDLPNIEDLAREKL